MRRAIQLALLGLFLWLVYLTKWPPSDSVLVNLFLSLDPLLSIQAALAGRVWVAALGYGIALLALALLLGRFFCGWMCPFGTCFEVGDELLFKKKKRLWKNGERKWRGVKYALLAVILTAAIFGQSLAFIADPICWATRLFGYAIWPLGATLGNAGLDISRPVFEKLGWMNLARMDIHQPIFGPYGLAALVFFATLLWLGRYQRRFWCRVLCPLGALLALPSRFAIFHRRVSDACRMDGLCGRVCETGAIGEDFKTYDPGECIQCGRCEKSCHFDAVKFAPSFHRTQTQPTIDLSRRQVLASVGVGAVFAGFLAKNPDRFLVSDDGLRPPGSMPEDDFLATCVRCGQCAKACPTNCLQPSTLQTGVAGWMTPRAVMRLGPCDQNCSACGQVCPTGAIRSLDLGEKPYAKIGNAVIDHGRCIVWEQGRHCLVCDENCPYAAIYWQEVASGEHRPFINENRCNGCGQCEAACPVEGVAAVRVFPAGGIRLATGSYEDEAKKRGLDLKRIDRINGDYS